MWIHILLLFVIDFVSSSYLYKDEDMIIQRILRDTFISEEHEVRNYESYDHFGIKSDINEKIDSIIEI